jgi:hypothetical protein
MVNVFVTSTEYRGKNTTQCVVIPHRVVVSCKEASDKAFKFEARGMSHVWIPKSQAATTSFSQADEETQRLFVMITKGLGCSIHDVVVVDIPHWLYAKNFGKLENIQENCGIFDRMAMTGEEITKELKNI